MTRAESGELDLRESPLHGFQGDRGIAAPLAAVPGGLTIAVSREAGARGSTIGRRVGRKLGWPVYDQELLEYMAQSMVVRQGVGEELAPQAAHWADSRLDLLVGEHHLSQHPPVVNLARVMLALAASGKAVLIGRGAGSILPRASTLNVRLVAPLAERIAYMRQWLRLTEEEAAERVRVRDIRRNEFLATHFRCDPADLYQYDLILNSWQLGEEVCAELIAQAARSRDPIGAAENSSAR